MLIFNTLSQSKEEIKARDGKVFRMFVCGPTVQDNVHLGHAKTYIAFDVLARWLLRSGNRVSFLLNITDVDDKIFERGKKENVPYMQIADRFYNEFLSDIDALNILTISTIARVSNYIKEAVELIQVMAESGYAYELGGSYYFDTSKAKGFGKLSHQTPLQLQLKQIDAAPDKRNSVDFLLWRKITDATEGIWNCPLGPGRPGWHIEDSAIAFSRFEGPYDLHGGATELIFPHHEAELAQDEASSGQIPFVSTWMHTGLLLKDGEKMSKSLGNMVTIRDAMKSFSSDEIRYYFLKHHYRESFDFEIEELRSAENELEIIKRAAPRVSKLSKSSRVHDATSEKELFRKFANSMDDDLNTPKALEILLNLSREIVDREKAPEGRFEETSIFWTIAETLGLVLS